jgi:hypothetical protein
MKWTSDSERFAFYDTWHRACHILCNHRWWFKRERDKYDLHPVVEKAMSIYRPVDWQQLLLEWPHKAEDGERVAYTQNERKGAEDIQTVTSVGKYLRRHFDMPDHELRDIVALYDTSGHTLQFVHTTDEMVAAVRSGPHSCMSNSFLQLVAHPYAVYKPEYGWHMAVRKNGGQVEGRALCLNDDEEDGPVFVRSYKRCPNGGYSHADEKLEAWLKDQGYTKLSGWPIEARVARIEQEEGWFVMPYIDGDNRAIDDHSTYMTIESSGEYEACQTDGTVGDSGVECEDCGDRHDEDDSYWVGRWADRRIGPCCIDSYCYAYGARGNQYYESEDECVFCDDNDEHYVIDYLSDNDMVQLSNGSIVHIDNAVLIESCDEYYHTDDERICYAEDTERYELTDDCWQCAETCNWYTDDVDYVEVDGNTYHPDHAPNPDQLDLPLNETQGDE